ncbi:MAG: heavy metal-binding domain-containing protein, partial [Candidatus Magasanikbacteria bacterium]
MSTLNFSDKDILITSSHSIDDKKIVEYKGFLVSDVVMGRHVGRDFLSGLRDFFGGRSGSW